jgi:DNA-directed RNA polymerase specialized sigma24 family protein
MNEQACEGLLQAARERDRAGVQRAVAALYPGLRGYLGGIMTGETGRMARTVGWTTDDLASTLVKKLLESPPDRASAAPPVATVKAWVRATAAHEVIDEWRKQRRRRRIVIPETQQKGAPDGTTAPHELDEEVGLRSREPVDLQRYVTPERELAAAGMVESLRAMLEACFPLGVDLFDVLVAAGGEDDATLAERWSTSVLNVQRRRTRVRRYCAAFQILSSLAPDERVDDEAVARKMDAEFTVETRRLIGSVRHHIVLRGRGR